MVDTIIKTLANSAFEVLKKGIKVTKEFLMEKLSEWNVEEKDIEEVEKCVNETPETFLVSEGLFREYLKTQDKLIDILNKMQPSTTNNIQNSANNNSGFQIGINQGNIINNVGIEEKQAPMTTQNKKLDIFDMFSKYRPIQIVKSYEASREDCVPQGQTSKSITAPIFIPDNAKNNDGFVMVLFAFNPEENFTNYCKEDYILSFEMETSSNIEKVQLQIKNSKQNQFVDINIENGKFNCLLKDLSNEKCWESVKEICFVISTTSMHVGNKGYIRIADLAFLK